MADPKFFNLFRTLQADETADFRKYLKRMHGHETVALELYDFIRKTTDKNKCSDIDYICRKLYRRETPATRKNLLNSLSDLYLWLKDFLLFNNATNGGFDSRLLWLKILKERALVTEFSREAPSLIANRQSKSIEDYLNITTINHHIFYCRPAGRPLPDGRALLDVGNDLDIYYLLAKFRLACELINLKNLRPETEISGDSPSILPEIALIHRKAEPPLLVLYREVYRLLASDQEHNYTEVIRLLIHYGADIDTNELHTLFSYLNNYAAAQIRNGREEYWASTHLLNKFGVDHRIFTQENRISSALLNNIAAIAAQEKDFKWADAFLASHSRYLPEEIREEAILLARASIAFEKMEFKKVLLDLDGKDFKGFLDAIRSRALVMKSMYELQEDHTDPLKYCLTFENYLRRSRQVKRDAVRGTLNAIQVLKMLIRRKSAKDQILNVIENARPIYFKSWLLNKLKDYKRQK